MTDHNTLDDVIRAGLELRLECLRCHFTERADPEDAKRYVGISRQAHQSLGDPADPDFTLERCLDGLSCPVCGASDFKIDVIKPLKSLPED